ncbi:MAG: hypothetical protein IPO21_06135, partial [Bacteroidales bacterium]|nr:hypothetical protein [Bacteroidales bacterium]
MKKSSYLFVLLFGIAVLAQAQLKVISNGNVGIGTITPTQGIHLKAAVGGPSSLIAITNTNNHTFEVGNHTTSLWGGIPNTFTIVDMAGVLPKFEIKSGVNTCINDRLVVGDGYSGDAP